MNIPSCMDYSFALRKAIKALIEMAIIVGTFERAGIVNS